MKYNDYRGGGNFIPSPLVTESFIDYCYGETIATESSKDMVKVFDQRMVEIKELKKKIDAAGDDPKEVLPYFMRIKQILEEVDNAITHMKFGPLESIGNHFHYVLPILSGIATAIGIGIMSTQVVPVGGFWLSVLIGIGTGNLVSKVTRPLAKSDKTKMDIYKIIEGEKEIVDQILVVLKNPDRYKKYIDKSIHSKTDRLSGAYNKFLDVKRKALANKIAKILNQKMGPLLRKYNGKGKFIVDNADDVYRIYLYPRPSDNVEDKIYEDFINVVDSIDCANEMREAKIELIRYLDDGFGVSLSEEDFC